MSGKIVIAGIIIIGFTIAAMGQGTRGYS